MKKAIAITLIMIMMSSATAQANEIAGSRVAGQGAVCAAGQGKGVEYNIATKQETSYCYELPVVIPPTTQQVETKAKETVASTITTQKNENALTVIAEQTVTVEPQPITEELTKVEVNATTKVVTVSPLTQSEKEQLSKDRAVSNSRQEAKEKAATLAKENQGTEQCVKWAAQGQSGQECELDPIPATKEEVEDWWTIFIRAFDDWYTWLMTDWWSWND